MATDKIRLSLDLTTSMNEVVEEMAAELGVSKAELLKRSIALMEAAVSEQKKGRRIGSSELDSDLKTEFILSK